ncbi:serine/threonine-protein kinase [Pseudonocardia sp. N23]|uniref:serine/threonine-protein kinase n=1 Tax=Pseudonocardia sp. N23 TaxID=1987376 RepID=UPI000C025479|nr:serine/threonine-protein kinase [Pseudonocardia sp. N23]GAY10088.1 serine/threonine protein kinase [Pseudonocardia sp. N23]
MNPSRVIGGRYVVLGELGRGGMGVVWRAEDRVIGRQVAVKELRLPDGLSPEEHARFRERLLREARTAGRLNHPGIVTVHDVVADEGVDHIVMELIEADTLTDVVSRNGGPLDERSATEIARQVLAALRRAHAGGVVHRDVKPSNVMLGNDGRVTLTDFGIAHAADDPRLTTTGLLVGSPGYMAPERLEGADAAPPADLWALGATLYYAVEAAGPFNRETTPQTIYAVMNEDPPPPRCTGPLGAVIAGLLIRNPATRLTAEQAEVMLARPGDVTGTMGTSPTSRIVAPTHPGPPFGTGTAPAPKGRTLPIVIAAVVALLAGLGLGAWGGASLLGGGSGGGGGTTASVVQSFTYGPGGQIPQFDYTYPTCLNAQLVPGRFITSNASTSCTDRHDLEIFESLTPFDSSTKVPYPAVKDLTDYGRSACSLIFDSARVTGTDKATLTLTVLVPGQQTFDAANAGSSAGSRSVLCVLGRTDGAQLTETRIAGS